MKKPSRKEAENAIITLLQYIGEDPDREGLIDTPKRVISSFEEIFSGYGYKDNNIENIETKFLNKKKYNDIILLKDINFKSCCEHHLLPIIGTIDVAYIPDKYIIGISKIARIIELVSRKLQIQENIIIEIAEHLVNIIDPLGIAVKITAQHFCMIIRGVNQGNTTMSNSYFTGIFKDNNDNKQQFFNLIK